jgi:hypothetical protein
VQLAAVKVLEGIVSNLERELFLREVKIIRGINLVGVVPVLVGGVVEGGLYLETRWLECTTVVGLIAQVIVSSESKANREL